jgi:hypothetical protein
MVVQSYQENRHFGGLSGALYHPLSRGDREEAIAIVGMRTAGHARLMKRIWSQLTWVPSTASTEKLLTANLRLRVVVSHPRFACRLERSIVPPLGSGVCGPGPCGRPCGLPLVHWGAVPPPASVIPAGPWSRPGISPCRWASHARKHRPGRASNEKEFHMRFEKGRWPDIAASQWGTVEAR